MAATKLIIADDDFDFRLSLKLALEVAGYSVELAANGREALELQRRAAAGILITDVFMPDADGLETIDAFRKEFPATKIVVISGAAKLARRNYLVDAQLIGVDATLGKPFQVEQLLATLRGLSAAASP
jgi:CheY-like chemotaxis protein